MEALRTRAADLSLLGEGSLDAQQSQRTLASLAFPMSDRTALPVSSGTFDVAGPAGEIDEADPPVPTSSLSSKLTWNQSSHNRANRLSPETKRKVAAVRNAYGQLPSRKVKPSPRLLPVSDTANALGLPDWYTREHELNRFPPHIAHILRQKPNNEWQAVLREIGQNDVTQRSMSRQPQAIDSTPRSISASLSSSSAETFVQTPKSPVESERPSVSRYSADEYCEICRKSFSGKSEFKRHQKQHSRVYVCTEPDCASAKTGFASHKDLERHKLNAHIKRSSEGYNFRCVHPECLNVDNIFERRDDILRHIRGLHGARDIELYLQKSDKFGDFRDGNMDPSVEHSNSKHNPPILFNQKSTNEQVAVKRQGMMQQQMAAMANQQQPQGQQQQQMNPWMQQFYQETLQGYTQRFMEQATTRYGGNAGMLTTNDLTQVQMQAENATLESVRKQLQAQQLQAQLQRQQSSASFARESAKPVALASYLDDSVNQNKDLRAKAHRPVDFFDSLCINYTISEDLTGNQDSIMELKLARLAVRCGHSNPFHATERQSTVDQPNSSSEVGGDLKISRLPGAVTPDSLFGSDGSDEAFSDDGRTAALDGLHVPRANVPRGRDHLIIHPDYGIRSKTSKLSESREYVQYAVNDPHTVRETRRDMSAQAYNHNRNVEYFMKQKKTDGTFEFAVSENGSHPDSPSRLLSGAWPSVYPSSITKTITNSWYPPVIF